MNLETIINQSWDENSNSDKEQEELFSALMADPKTSAKIYALTGVGGILVKNAFNQMMAEKKFKASEVLEKSDDVVKHLATEENLFFSLRLIYLGYLIGKAVEQTRSLEKLVA